MKSLSKWLLVVLIIGANEISVNAQNLTATDIVKKADDKSRGLTSEGEMTMKVVRPDWSRSVSMKYWSKGSDYFMIYITSPAKEEGQTFLKRKNEMWNWIPDITSMVKIPPSMMMQSWMGSDFTNDDLVKQSSIVVDYEHKLIVKETIRGMECYKIELIPKPESAVVWGKIIAWITTSGFDQWKTEFYNEDNDLVNTQNAYDIKKMGDRNIPTQIEIIPANEQGNKTVLYIHKSLFNQKIDDGFFSQQNMKRIH